MKRLLAFMLALLSLAVGCSSNVARPAAQGEDIFDAIAEDKPIAKKALSFGDDDSKTDAATSIDATPQPTKEPEVFTCGDYEYVLLEDGTAEIHGYTGGTETLVIPDTLDGHSVTRIGDRPFRNNRSLISVTIPDSVTSIGYNAFNYCDSLTNISIPNSVTIIGPGAFHSCRNLTSITIPESVTNIGSSAFSYCINLISINIPDSVIAIGVNPFENCDALKKISVSQDHPLLTVIDGGLFNKADKSIICYPAGLKAKEYQIPQGTTVIGSFAFGGCERLTSISMPNSVTTIEKYAFFACSKLTNINIPDSVTTIGSHAFSSCYGLSSITIPDSVITIGENPFSYAAPDIKVSENNPALAVIDGVLFSKADKRLVYYPVMHTEKEYEIPQGISIIDGFAFMGCPFLTSITIPDSVTNIGERAFEGISNLTCVTIPDSVTSIGDYAFHGCYSLTTITVPDQVKDIGLHAFADCRNLSSIIVSRGSYAAQYCEENDLPCTYSDAMDLLNH